MRQEHISKTELTGSNSPNNQVITNVTVTAGSTYISEVIDCEGFSKIGVVVIINGESFDSYVIFNPDGTGAARAAKQLPNNPLSSSGKGDQFNVISRYARIWVKNTGTTDMQIDGYERLMN